MADAAKNEQPSDEERALLERVGALEDREAIRQLAQDYRRHLDARDLQAYAALFADDGEWHGGTGYAKGPEAIRTMLEERLSPNPPAPGPTTFHLVTEPAVELDGDRATGLSTWALLQRGPGDVPRLAALGHYEDLYVRVAGAWRFGRRLAVQDIPQHPLAPR
jgi:uncharacterized protein (TIGR02246 family)